MDSRTRAPLENATLFRELEHTGDLAIEVSAPDRKEMFRRAALALGALLVERSDVVPTETRALSVGGSTDVDLLHDLLAALLTLFMVDNFIWSEAEVQDNEAGLAVTLHGERFDPNRHSFRGEIKAVTYHQIAVEHPGPEQWRARLTFDI
jgi:SHS2 domain-containing protein